MTSAVLECPAFSEGCEGVGKTSSQNRSRILVLQLPERGALTTPVHPKAKATKETLTR
jgi:hypothetical protein